ncbi:MAG TPA: pyrroline-5-carboxylate reductase [Burkholderiales bacterium]|nr:pyrroline-5-carboxylate reductase [Burkholderiales bacterium]
MRVLFMGGGNMATAMIGGLLQQGFAAGDLRAVDVSEEARLRLQQRFGVAVAADAGTAVTEDVVLLAVKPQQMQALAKRLRALLRGQLVISIAAGIRTTDLSRWLGGHARIVRAMPNTPALVRAGVTGLFAPAGVGSADRDAARAILGAVGTVVWVDDEAGIDAVTAVSGSGPAYVFYFIEALERAAAGLGLDAARARELAVQTFVGAAKLAGAGDEAPSVLRERVTSKGGTTEAALKAMEAGEVGQRIARAVQAAAARSHELGDEFGRDQAAT